MPLRNFQGGSKFNVCAYFEAAPGGKCPLVSWMEELPDRAKRSFGVTINQHAADGPLRNKQKSEQLEDGIYEFKCHFGPGYRILWFYLPGSTTVLTHGFTKGANLGAEIGRAKAIRAALASEEK